VPDAKEAGADDGHEEDRRVGAGRCPRGVAQAFRRDQHGRVLGAGGPATPAEIAAARQEGAMHAGAQWERMHSRPECNGSRDAIALLCNEPDEEGSMIAAAFWSG
jgi:hypothetical protein